MTGGNANFNGIGGEGWFLTGQIGADYQVAPSWVIGAFIDYDFSDISTELSANGPVVPLTASADVTIDSQLFVGARVGWLPTASQDTLWYAVVGYTRVEFDDARISGTVNGAPFAFSASLPDFSGYFVGGGVETMLTENISLKGEYRYTGLSSESLFSIPGVLDFTDEPSLHTARVVVSYRFPMRRDVLVDEPYK